MHMREISTSQGQDRVAADSAPRWLPVDCPICGGQQPADYARRSDGAKVASCSGCGLLFLNPQPDAQTIRGFYTNEFFTAGTYQGHYFESHGCERGIQPVWQRILRDISARIEPGRLLDIGCAHGFFLQAATQYNFEPYGVELVDEAAAHASKSGCQVTVGDLRSAHFPDHHFQVVTMLDVIEHVADPRAELEEIRRVLVPGGILCMLTPNARQARVLGEGWKGFRQSFTHLLFFEPRSITRLLQATGFRPVKMFSMQPNLHLSFIGKAAQAVKVSNSSVIQERRPALWKRIVRGLWNLGNRVLFWLPEKLLFGHMLCVIAAAGADPAARPTTRNGK